jgi:predicted outer membrane repeat protein
MEANALGGSSAHWIFLWPGQTHTLSLDTDGGGHVTDAGPSTDDLDITANIVIMGNFATIQRTGSCTINNNAATGEFRIFEVHSGGKLTLQDVTVRDGCADGVVQNGGGIAVQSGGELTVINSALTGHRASNKGGGIYSNGTVTILNSTLAGNSAFDGGGVLNGLGVTMTIRNSTFSGNTAGTTGGGIYNDGTLTLTNSTLSSNSAGGAGSGIRHSGNMAKLSFVTVAENSGKGISVLAGTLQIRHSIVAKNTGGNCGIVAGTFTPSGNNFADDNTCTGFAALTPSTLGPLASNGGATQTHALLPGSQARNAASDCQDLEGNTVPSDQRGVPRPQPAGGACDAGAYEAQVQVYLPLIAR